MYWLSGVGVLQICLLDVENVSSTSNLKSNERIRYFTAVEWGFAWMNEILAFFALAFFAVGEGEGGGWGLFLMSD